MTQQAFKPMKPGHQGQPEEGAVCHAPSLDDERHWQGVTLCMEGGGEQPEPPYWIAGALDLSKVTCQDCLEWMHA